MKCWIKPWSSRTKLDWPFGRMSTVTVVVEPLVDVVEVDEATSRDCRRFVGVSRPSSLLAPRPLSAPAVELLPPGDWLRRSAAAPAARGSSKNDTVGLTSRRCVMTSCSSVMTSRRCDDVAQVRCSSGCTRVVEERHCRSDVTAASRHTCWRHRFRRRLLPHIHTSGLRVFAFLLPLTDDEPSNSTFGYSIVRRV